MSPRFPDPARFAGSRLLRVQSDERLVALTRDGYETAFSAIVDRYRAPLERYAGRIVGESRAEDAVQQAFANAHRALMRDDRPIALKAWLYRITHNAALNQLRAIRDEVTLDDESLGRPATAMAATHDTTSVAELQARLRETLDLIAALPATQRDALLLAELEGRSHDEIAIALDIPSETVRHRVMQARTTLRAAVSAIVPYPIAASLAAAAGSDGGSARTAAEIAAGAGTGAVAIKITAGLTATGALVTAFALPSLTIPGSTDRDAGRQVVARSAEADDPRTQLATAPLGGPARPAAQGGGTAGAGASTNTEGSAGTASILAPSIDGSGSDGLRLGELVAPPVTSMGYEPVAVEAPFAADPTSTAERRRGSDGPRIDDDRSRSDNRAGTKGKRPRIDGARRDQETVASAAPADGGQTPAAGGGNGNLTGASDTSPRGSGPSSGFRPTPGADAPSGGKPDGGDDRPSGGQPTSPGPGGVGAKRPSSAASASPQAEGAGGAEHGKDDRDPASDPQRRDDDRARKPS